MIKTQLFGPQSTPSYHLVQIDKVIEKIYFHIIINVESSW